MKTRREILKGSLGLAGIIAAGKAPAAVVKSLVGAQLTGNTEEAGGWKNPYVTDGLVAMWDGIWNVGFGVHDPTTDYWKDLIGDHNLTITSRGSIVDDALVTSGAGPAAIYNGFIGDVKTVEISLEHTGGNCVMWNGVGCHLMYWTSAVSGSYGYEMCSMSQGNLVGFISSRETKGSTISFNLYKRTVGANNYLDSAYVNSSSKALAIFNNQWTQGGEYDSFKLGAIRNDNWLASKCRFHCVRFYSRSLSADEIAANYAIDKERFGLI